MSTYMITYNLTRGFNDVSKIKNNQTHHKRIIPRYIFIDYDTVLL